MLGLFLVSAILIFLTYGCVFATLSAIFPKLNQKTVMGISAIIALVVSPFAILVWALVSIILDGNIPYPWDNGFRLSPKKQP